MAEEKPKTRSGLSDPQVLTALITGIVSVVVAVVGLVPTLIAANTPTATPTLVPTHTFTPLPTESVPPTAFNPTVEVIIPTGEASAVPPTITPRPLEPVVTDVPPTEARVDQSDPNVLLIYDDVSFTLVNVSGETLSLKDIKFRSSSGKWEAKDWGSRSVYEQLPNKLCLRIRDSGAGNRNPPGDCKSLHALMVTGGEALFWLGTSEFEVRQKKDLLATCSTDTDRCAIYVPQN
jgi:hypothetical protein